MVQFWTLFGAIVARRGGLRESYRPHGGGPGCSFGAFLVPLGTAFGFSRFVEVEGVILELFW